MSYPWKIYNVYCEAVGVEVITPDYPDAERTFKKYVREYPSETVDFDVIEELPAGETVDDVASGIHSGKRRRVMQCCPD